jgi:hypothetical protein
MELLGVGLPWLGLPWLGLPWLGFPTQRDDARALGHSSNVRGRISRAYSFRYRQTPATAETRLAHDADGVCGAPDG